MSTRRMLAALVASLVACGAGEGPEDADLCAACGEPGVVALSKVGGALASLGYRPHPVADSSARDARRAQDRDYLVRIGVAAANMDA